MGPIGAAARGSALRMDLLSAVMHELGHVLGYEHADATRPGLAFMAEDLAAGQRLVPADLVAASLGATRLGAAASAGALGHANALPATPTVQAPALTPAVRLDDLVLPAMGGPSIALLPWALLMGALWMLLYAGRRRLLEVAIR